MHAAFGGLFLIAHIVILIRNGIRKGKQDRNSINFKLILQKNRIKIFYFTSSQINHKI